MLDGRSTPRTARRAKGPPARATSTARSLPLSIRGDFTPVLGHYAGDMNDAARRLSLRVVTQPKDTNHYGTIFGGVILSYIDQAGFVEAMRHGDHKWVTVA